MRTLILCTILTGFTVLYPHGPLQAQMQTKNFSYNKEKSSKNNKPKLFVTNDEDKTSSDKEEDKTTQEIDRIFEKYKALSEQQDIAAAQKPLKTKKQIAKKGKPAPETPEKPVRSGFSSLLDQYEKTKANRSKTNSIQFKTPDNLNQ